MQKKQALARSAQKFGTKTVKHYNVKGPINPLTTPIYPSSTYLLDSVDHGARLSNRTTLPDQPPWFYSRWGNPTTDVAAQILTELEQAHASLIVGSGMAAITTTLISTLHAGDHIIAPRAVYGGTFEFLSTMGSRLGYDVTFVDATDPENYRKALKPNTRVLYTETPTNPTMRLTDLNRIVEIAKSIDGITITDSTFGSPANQQPLTIGIDIVVHSATKYLGGHSDIIAGSISVNSSELFEHCYHTLKLLGGVLSPYDAYLLIRGIKTLDLRIKKHNQNALKVAQYLEKHKYISKVHYPGLETHPDHDLAIKQMSGFGGMLSFEVEGGLEAGRQVVESFQLCNLAVSLGGVETLVEHPATMTHSMVPVEERRKGGISDGLIRFSVGIEDVTDIIADLDQALSTLK